MGETAVAEPVAVLNAQGKADDVDVRKDREEGYEDADHARRPEGDSDGGAGKGMSESRRHSTLVS